MNFQYQIYLFVLSKLIFYKRLFIAKALLLYAIYNKPWSFDVFAKKNNFKSLNKKMYR